MSTRMMISIPLLVLLVTMAGCAAVSPFGDDSLLQTEQAALSRDDLANRAKVLEKEKLADQKRLADQQEEIARMAKDLSDQQAEIARANRHVSELNKSLEELNAQVRQLQEARQRERPLQETELVQPKKAPKPIKKTKSTKREVRKTISEAEENAPEAKLAKEAKQPVHTEPAETQPTRQKALRIKVLAGDGNIASAKGLSKRLSKMGYRVKTVDQAPRSDFDTTVVFYGNAHRTTAEAMAKRLGDGAAVRPLTWSSDFDIIVVTGRKP